jgi:hypothetical protein
MDYATAQRNYQEVMSIIAEVTSASPSSPHHRRERRRRKEVHENSLSITMRKKILKWIRLRALPPDQ